MGNDSYTIYIYIYIYTWVQIYFCIYVFQYRTQKSSEQLLGGFILPNKGSQIMLWDSSSTWDYCAILKRGVALLRLDVRMHGSTWSSPATERSTFSAGCDAHLVIQKETGPDEQWLLCFIGILICHKDPIMNQSRISWNVRKRFVLPLLKWCVLCVL